MEWLLVTQHAQRILREYLLNTHSGREILRLTRDMGPDDLPILKGFQLLTTKPVLYVANVAESADSLLLRATTYSTCSVRSRAQECWTLAAERERTCHGWCLG